MRVLYPEEINKEREAMIPFLEFRPKVGWALKTDAPREIVRRYNVLMAKIEAFDRRCMG